MKTKLSMLVLVFVALTFLMGCAQTTWQAKGTAAYVAAGKTMKITDETFQGLKKDALVSQEQINLYNSTYKKAYDSYWLAGDGWKLAMKAGTDVEQKKYMEAFTKNFGDFQTFVGNLVALVNSITVKQQGGK